MIVFESYWTVVRSELASLHWGEKRRKLPTFFSDNIVVFNGFAARLSVPITCIIVMYPIIIRSQSAAALSCSSRAILPIRRYSTPPQPRPHPLAPQNQYLHSKPAPVGRGRWSNAVLLTISTLVGTLTYAIGTANPLPSTASSGPPTSLLPVSLSAAGYASAMRDLEQWMPSDNIRKDQETLIEHGYSQWSYHQAQSLPGCVIYPRSTEDVVKIVKVSSSWDQLT